MSLKIQNAKVAKNRHLGIGVILGGTRGTRTPHFLEWGYRTPHFSRAVTRKITTQIQAFSTEQDTNCQIGASARRLLLHARASAAAGILLLLPSPPHCTMTQNRLNHVAVCNEHHDYIELLNLKDILNTFANCNERRQLLFGNF